LDLLLLLRPPHTLLFVCLRRHHRHHPKGLRILVIHPFADTIRSQYAKHAAALRCLDRAATDAAVTGGHRSHDGNTTCPRGDLLFPANNRAALPLFRELLTYRPAVGASRGRTWREGLASMERDLTLLAKHGSNWERYAVAEAAANGEQQAMAANASAVSASVSADAVAGASTSVSAGPAAAGRGLLSFDVALVSCGAWGPLVQAFLKRSLGASSVYLGGALQLHFGIWGKRWQAPAAAAAAAAAEGSDGGSDGESGGGGSGGVEFSCEGPDDVGCFATEAWVWPSTGEAALLQAHVGGAATAGGYTGGVGPKP